MPINLTKGANVSLSKSVPGLTHILIGLGWDARSTDGKEFDLDSSVFMLSAAGKVRSGADFIFYNQPVSSCGSVKHLGDNRTGDGIGDDEKITVDLSHVPADVEKLVIGVTFYEAGQNFGMVSQAFVRVVNAGDDTEIVRYDLSEDFSVETALVFGELYRHSGEWKFRAVGQGFQGGLEAMANTYGVIV